MFSVLNQSYGDFCVRIFDNASGDGTEEAAGEMMRLDSRVQYYRHPQNIGGLQNMMFGMARVTTPYFNVLCDDDLLMPGLLGRAATMHEQAETPRAFVSSRVATVDPAGLIGEPYPQPEQTAFAAPDGVIACLRYGLSMPGVIFRTTAMAAVGPPRTSWWNWTESGWPALAAMRHPIAFTPELGAIVFVHPGSTSSRMDGAEFRVTWFRMLAELRGAASSAGVSDEWWRRHIGPLAGSRFLGTVTRLCTRDGAAHYPELGQSAVAGGLNPFGVRTALGVARAARAVGIGAVLNAVFDAMRGDTLACDPTPASAEDTGLRAAATVFTELNRQAGLG